ncbi:hypothetical protein [Caulobacter phage BL94]|nr:hypothetical protein [Caulobacter phage BL94]
MPFITLPTASGNVLINTAHIVSIRVAPDNGAYVDVTGGSVHTATLPPSAQGVLELIEAAEDEEAAG